MQRTHPTNTRYHRPHPSAHSVLTWTAWTALAAATVVGLAIVAGGPRTVQPLPETYSLSRGTIGMLGGTSAAYGLEEPGIEPAPGRVQEAVGAYLVRVNQPGLASARLYEFGHAYQADIFDTTTHRPAFALMIGKATLEVSPKAGPNLLWNTRYGGALADLGGGYGMTGRQVVSAELPDPNLTQAQARRLALGALDAYPRFTLSAEVADFDGYYEYHLLSEGQLVGDLDVNAYTGQLWMNQWGQAPRREIDLPTPTDTPATAPVSAGSP